MKHIECRDCDEQLETHQAGETHCECGNPWPCPLARRVDGDDLVPKGWVDGDEETSVEEWGQREWNSGQRTGVDQGIELAAKFVDKRAAEAFEKEDDATAKTLRALAKRIRAEMKR